MSASLAASGGLTRAPRTGVWAALELLKPITWFAPMWAFLCGLVSSGRPFAANWIFIAAGVALCGTAGDGDEPGGE